MRAESHTVFPIPRADGSLWPNLPHSEVLSEQYRVSWSVGLSLIKNTHTHIYIVGARRNFFRKLHAR